MDHAEFNKFIDLITDCKLLQFSEQMSKVYHQYKFSQDQINQICSALTKTINTYVETYRNKSAILHYKYERHKAAGALLSDFFTTEWRAYFRYIICAIAYMTDLIEVLNGNGSIWCDNIDVIRNNKDLYNKYTIIDTFNAFAENNNLQYFNYEWIF